MEQHTKIAMIAWYIGEAKPDKELLWNVTKNPSCFGEAHFRLTATITEIRPALIQKKQADQEQLTQQR